MCINIFEPLSTLVLHFCDCSIIGRGWNHPALPLAETNAQPQIQIEVRPRNCRCPDVPDIPEVVRKTVINLVFTPDGLQQAINNRFTRLEEIARCNTCNASGSSQHITWSLAVPSPILVFALYNLDEIDVPDVISVPTLNGPKRYQVISGIEYSGTASSGHFVAHLRFEDGYACVNDSKEITISPPNVIRKCQLFIFVETHDNPSDDSNVMFV